MIAFDAQNCYIIWKLFQTLLTFTTTRDPLFYMTNIFLKILILSWLNRITILRLYANNIFSSFLNSSLRDSMTCLANLESYALIVFRRVEWEVIKHPIVLRLFTRWFSCFKASFLLNLKVWLVLLWIWIDSYVSSKLYEM